MLFRSFQCLLLLGILSLVLHGCVEQSVDDAEPVHQEATHPALKGLNQIRFLTVADFIYSADGGREFEISPGGDWIAWRAFDEEGRITLRFRKRDGTGDTNSIYSTEPAGYFFGKFDRFIYLNTNGRLYRFDAKDIEKPYVDVTPRGFDHWHIGGRPEFSEGVWVVASRDRNPAFSDIYTVNPDGSGKQLLEKNPGNIIDWHGDDSNNFFWRQLRGSDDATVHQYTTVPSLDLSDIKWKTAFSVARNEDVSVISPPDHKGRILAFSNRDRDTIALVKINPENGTETVLAKDDSSDATDVFISDSLHQEPALVWFAKEPMPEALNDWGKAFLKLLHEDSAAVKWARIVSNSKDKRYLVVELATSEVSSEFILFDMELAKKEKIGDTPLTFNGLPQSEQRQVSIQTADGLLLPSVLTLPRGIAPKNLPMVLLLHGGPAQRDCMRYDAEVQLLANRGYAVLQVNYRGSTGFGKKFQEAGYRQFGRKIQSDVVAATEWAIKNEFADPKAIAVAGTSYGGYAALMALAQKGELFAAGISAFGPTDLYYQTTNNPFSWQLFGHSWKRYFGDPEIADDAKMLRQFSPVNLVSSITKPVLLVHGRRDRIVGVEQAERLEKLLSELGRKPNTLYFDNEWHGLTRMESKILYMKKIEKFLADNLGGRTSIVEEGADQN